MSRHVSHSHTRVLNDVRTLPNEELATLYGIEINEDGTVYDPTENRTFDDLNDWATYIDEQEDDDNYSSFNKIGGKHSFDDDF